MSSFRFRRFTINQDRCAMKVGTDGVLLGAWASVEGVRTVLDIGTGTGLIALMLAQRSPMAEVHAVEIDADSAAQAAENAAASPWAGRVRVIHRSIQEYARDCSVPYDLIVANPPYFRDSLKSPSQARNRARHAEILTFGDLARSVSGLLAPGGRFCLILPPEESRVFEKTALVFGLYSARTRNVHSMPGKPVERVLMQFEKRSSPPIYEPAMVLQMDDPVERSAEYDNLTREFYL